jgi:integrase/recombinase XerD
MDCAQEIITAIETSLYKQVDPCIVRMIEDKLGVILLKYHIEPASTDLTEYRYTTPQAVDAFLACKTVSGCSAGTISLYRITLDTFFADIRRQPGEVTSMMIRGWLYRYQMTRKNQRGEDVSPKTISSKRSILCSFFGWASAEGITAGNPCAVVDKIKAPSRERHPLTEIELEQLRGACHTVRDRAIVETLYSTGCRVSELCSMRISDIDWESRSVSVIGKGNKQRTVYLNAKALIALRTYLGERRDTCPAVIAPSKGVARRVGKESIEGRIRDLGKDAGIQRRVYPHLLRHTMATEALAHGMPIDEVSALLGHANLDTTQIYAKTQRENIQHDHRRCIV